MDNPFVMPSTKNLLKSSLRRDSSLLILLLRPARSRHCLLSGQSKAISAIHGAPHDPQTDAGFDHFYNMDYDRATQEFEKIRGEASERSVCGQPSADRRC